MNSSKKPFDERQKDEARRIILIPTGMRFYLQTFQTVLSPKENSAGHFIIQKIGYFPQMVLQGALVMDWPDFFIFIACLRYQMEILIAHLGNLKYKNVHADFIVSENFFLMQPFFLILEMSP